MASELDVFEKQGVGTATTLSAPGKATSATSITVGSTANFPTTTGITFAIRVVDGNGELVAGTYTEWVGTVTSGTTLAMNAVPVYGSDQVYAAGSTTQVYMPLSSYSYNKMIDGLTAEHEQLDGTHKATLITSRTEDTNPDPDADFLLTYDTSATALKKVRPNNISLYAPQGFLQNGKITTSVASNNITVAIKTLADANPSVTDPVYVRIGNTVRAITAALSVTKNAGTNWFNSGSSEHATQDIDYFTYLGWNATAGEVVIGFSRIAHGRIYSDFSATTTSDTYCAINNITGAAAGNEYENVGRFNATLSATAAFNWSIPATSIVVCRPIFETRELVYVPTLTSMATGNGTLTARYSITWKELSVRMALVFGTTSTLTGDVSITTPITTGSYAGNPNLPPLGGAVFFDTSGGTYIHGVASAQSPTLVTVRAIKTDTTYGSVGILSSTLPFTWATGDEFVIDFKKKLA